MLDSGSCDPQLAPRQQLALQAVLPCYARMLGRMDVVNTSSTEGNTGWTELHPTLGSICSCWVSKAFYCLDKTACLLSLVFKMKVFAYMFVYIVFLKIGTCLSLENVRTRNGTTCTTSTRLDVRAACFSFRPVCLILPLLEYEHACVGVFSFLKHSLEWFNDWGIQYFQVLHLAL